MKRERMPAPWRSVIDEVGSRCAAAGLDLVQPFQIAWYNGVVVDAFRLPDLGRPSALGVLVGNTRALWPRFLAALRADARALDESHPLDTYVRAAVLGALEPLAHRWEARFSFEPPPRRIAMQRLAHISGFAYLSPSHLSVHATYGPWIALRAAVVIDINGPAGAPPQPPNPCPDCESHCLPRFRHAASATGATLEGHAAIERYWRLWLTVRDACPTGRAHRYSDDQVRYHYTKDRDDLRRLLGSVGP